MSRSVSIRSPFLPFSSRAFDNNGAGKLPLVCTTARLSARRLKKYGRTHQIPEGVRSLTKNHKARGYYPASLTKCKGTGVVRWSWSWFVSCVRCPCLIPTRAATRTPQYTTDTKHYPRQTTHERKPKIDLPRYCHTSNLTRRLVIHAPRVEDFASDGTGLILTENVAEDIFDGRFLIDLKTSQS